MPKYNTKNAAFNSAPSLMPFVVICFLVLSSSLSFALPTLDQGLGVGFALVNGATGQPIYNLSENSAASYQETNFGAFSCSGEVSFNTGATTNSTYSDISFPCSASDVLSGYEAVAMIDGFTGNLNTTLGSSIFSGSDLLIEILSFKRARPDSPIELTFENINYYVPPGDALEVVMVIKDENSNIIFQGEPVASNGSEGGLYGGKIYTYILDAIPPEIVSANVYRILELQLRAINGGNYTTGPDVTTPFQLTFGGGERCVELLQLGPAGFDLPAPVEATFGCPGLLPPGNCSDDARDAIVASRDYQKATRLVKRHCEDVNTPECSAAYQAQAASYQLLMDAQSQMYLHCSQ